MIETASWLEKKADGMLLRLYVQPGAKKTEVVGERAGRLKVKIHAPAQDGKANEELLSFLKKKLNATQVVLIRGETSRNKDVFLKSSHMEEQIRGLLVTAGC